MTDQQSLQKVIDVKGLTKKLGDRLVVDEVSFSVVQGECFGILGPNAAGKSTLLRMLYCNLSATAGEIYVLGLNGRRNFREIKSSVGVLPPYDSLEHELTVAENLFLFGYYHGLKQVLLKQRVPELLRRFGLEQVKDLLVSEVNYKFRRRTSLARACVHQPKLVFMDQPTQGLDPKGKLWFQNFVRTNMDLFGTAVVATDQVAICEAFCDRIAVMDKGEILSVGTPQELMNEHIGREVVEFEANTSDISYYVGRVKGASYPYFVSGNRICVFVRPDQDSRRVLDLVSSPRLTLRRPNLNDVFLKLSGRELSGDWL